MKKETICTEKLANSPLEWVKFLMLFVGTAQ